MGYFLEFHNVTLEELYEIKKKVNMYIEEIERERWEQGREKFIQQEVNQKGYFCSPVDFETKIECISIKSTELPVEWREKLGVQDDFDIYRNQPWSSSQRSFDKEEDDKIYLYYKRVDCPPEGSVFTWIFEDGQVEECQIKEGQLWANQELVCSIDKWDQYRFFVIPNTIKPEVTEKVEKVEIKEPTTIQVSQQSKDRYVEVTHNLLIEDKGLGKFVCVGVWDYQSGESKPLSPENIDYCRKLGLKYV